MDHDTEDDTNLNNEDAMELDEQDAVEPNQAPPTSIPSKLFLRALERSNRYFWKMSHSAQLDQIIYDKSLDGSERPIPANEMAVMAFNEISAQYGQGFFLYLKNRDSWKKHSTNEELCPSSRAPPQPG